MGIESRNFKGFSETSLSNDKNE